MAAAVEGSPMDWKPTSPIIYFPVHAGQRRKFDEITNDTEPFGRDEAPAPHQAVLRDIPEDRQFDPTDARNQSTAPRCINRVTFWVWAITSSTVATLGCPVEYAASCVKRRFIPRTQIRTAGDNRTFNTSRTSKRRRGYITPRQAYEQRSARSARLRDIPGRFPDTPLSAYAPRPSKKPSPAVSHTHPIIIADPEMYELPDMCELPGIYIESSLQQKALDIQRRLAQYNREMSETQQHAGNTGPGTVSHVTAAAASETSSRVTTGHLNMAWSKVSALEKEDLPAYDPQYDVDLDVVSIVRMYGQNASFVKPQVKLSPETAAELLAAAEKKEEIRRSTIAKRKWVVAELRRRTEQEEILINIEEILMKEKKTDSDRLALETNVNKLNFLFGNDDTESIGTTRSEEIYNQNGNDDIESIDTTRSEEIYNQNGNDDTESIDTTRSEEIYNQNGNASTETIVSTRTSRTHDQHGKPRVALIQIRPNQASMTRPAMSRKSAPCATRSSALTTSKSTGPKPLGAGPRGIKKLVRSFRIGKPLSPDLNATLISRPQKKTVGFYESPRTGRPITRIKRFVIGETIDHPSPASSHNETSMMSTISTESPSIALHHQAMLRVQLQARPTVTGSSLNNQLMSGALSDCPGSQKIDHTAIVEDIVMDTSSPDMISNVHPSNLPIPATSVTIGSKLPSLSNQGMDSVISGDSEHPRDRLSPTDDNLMMKIEGPDTSPRSQAMLDAQLQFLPRAIRLSSPDLLNQGTGDLLSTDARNEKDGRAVIGAKGISDVSSEETSEPSRNVNNKTVKDSEEATMPESSKKRSTPASPKRDSDINDSEEATMPESSKKRSTPASPKRDSDINDSEEATMPESSKKRSTPASPKLDSDGSIPGGPSSKSSDGNLLTTVKDSEEATMPESSKKRSTPASPKRDSDINDSEEATMPESSKKRSTPASPKLDSDGSIPGGPSNKSDDGNLSGKASSGSLDELLDDLSVRKDNADVAPRRSKGRKLAQEVAQELKEAEEKAALEKKEAEEKARKEREAAAANERLRQKAEELRQKRQVRRLTKNPIIQPLSTDWIHKIRESMRRDMTDNISKSPSGMDLTRADIGRVLPQPGTQDPSSGWLNDTVIEAYMQYVMELGNQRLGLKPDDAPKVVAFNTFFYKKLAEKGYNGVYKFAGKFKAAGKQFLDLEYLFVPVNVNKNHWTLAVVSPKPRTIEVYDSLHGSSAPIVANIRKFLQGELGSAYVAHEWTVREEGEEGDEGGEEMGGALHAGLGQGPTQDNGSDCGVFTVATTEMIVLGIDPRAVGPEDMPTQRRRVVAVFLNKGFGGEMAPLFDFVEG